MEQIGEKLEQLVRALEHGSRADADAASYNTLETDDVESGEELLRPEAKPREQMTLQEKLLQFSAGTTEAGLKAGCVKKIDHLLLAV